MEYQNYGGVLWSCIARNDVILCEAYDDAFSVDEKVRNASQQLLSKKNTPGWEFGSHKKLKAMKFHIYQHTEDNRIEEGTEFIIWVIAAVYNPQKVETAQVKSFIEKIIGISEIFRDDDLAWKYGNQYVVQESFSPVLRQRMQEVSYLGKVAMINDELDSLKSIMARNIEMILERGDKIDRLQEDSKKLSEMSAVFKKRSKKLKRHMLWQNAKHGMVVGTAVVAGVAVVVVPLVAL